VVGNVTYYAGVVIDLIDCYLIRNWIVARLNLGTIFVGVSILNCDNAVAIESIELVVPDDFEDYPYTAQETPYGLLGFSIKVDQPGQRANLGIYSSKQLLGDTTQWVRYDEVDGWKACEDGSTENLADGAVQYRITDGDAADADGVVNGVIINLAGPRFLGTGGNNTSLENNDQASSGGSGGSTACFISSLLR
jgi:hypothetical protein